MFDWIKKGSNVERALNVVSSSESDRDFHLSLSGSESYRKDLSQSGIIVSLFEFESLRVPE